MDWILSLGPWLFIGATVVTLLTLVALNIREHRASDDKKKGMAVTIKVVTIVATLLNLTLGVVLKVSKISLTRDDPAATTIRTFYTHIDNKEPKEFEAAWDLIHPARKIEIVDTIKSASDFAAKYPTTRRHTNFDIRADPSGGDGDGGALYWVRFDVVDMLDHSTIFSDFWLPTKSAVDHGFVSAEAIERIILEDLRRNYVVPDDKLPEIRKYIFDISTLRAVLGPKIVANTAMALKLKPIPSTMPARQSEIWTHHVFHVKMKKNDAGNWKIRSGLYPPVFESAYEPNSQKPTQ